MGKAEYLSQLNAMQPIINALNVAVPKEFMHGTNAASTIMGAGPYCNNNNLCKKANSALFGAPWNPVDPINQQNLL